MSLSRGTMTSAVRPLPAGQRRRAATGAATITSAAAAPIALCSVWSRRRRKLHPCSDNAARAPAWGAARGIASRSAGASVRSHRSIAEEESLDPCVNPQHPVLSQRSAPSAPPARQSMPAAPKQTSCASLNAPVVELQLLRLLAASTVQSVVRAGEVKPARETAGRRKARVAGPADVGVPGTIEEIGPVVCDLHQRSGVMLPRGQATG